MKSVGFGIRHFPAQREIRNNLIILVLPNQRIEEENVQVLRRRVLPDARIQIVGILVESNSHNARIGRSRISTALQEQRQEKKQNQHSIIVTRLLSRLLGSLKALFRYPATAVDRKSTRLN